MRTFVSGCGVAALAIALSACDGGAAVGVGVIATAPSASPAVTASISTVPPAPAFRGFGCFGPSQVAVAFDVVIVINVSMPMRLNDVMMQLIDGSHVGGPMVTFPQPSLTTQFGTTDVLAGIARPFRFSPQFQCDAHRADHVAAHLTLLDSRGASRGVTVAGPLP